jgi:uncharacterized protein YsxB (DUF464 family)
LITITVKGRNITTKGHADYAENGKDIVCSAVSILMQTLAIRSNSVQKSKGSMSIYTKDIAALELIVEGLKLIAETYPEHVEVIE